MTNYSEFVPYLFATSWGAKGHEDWLLPEWKSTKMTRYDHERLQFGTIEEEKRVIVVCPGLPSGKSNLVNYIILMAQSIFNILGFKSYCYTDAENWYKANIEGKYEGKTIEITGYCSGGAVAAYLGLKYGKKAYCFNAVPLGKALQVNSANENLIHQVSVNGDFMSDPSSLCCRIMYLFGARHPGTRHGIPSAYPGDGNKTHMWFSGSLLRQIFTNKTADECARMRGTDYSEAIGSQA